MSVATDTEAPGVRYKKSVDDAWPDPIEVQNNDVDGCIDEIRGWVSALDDDLVCETEDVGWWADSDRSQKFEYVVFQVIYRNQVIATFNVLKLLNLNPESASRKELVDQFDALYLRQRFTQVAVEKAVKDGMGYLYDANQRLKGLTKIPTQTHRL